MKAVSSSTDPLQEGPRVSERRSAYKAKKLKW